MLPESLGTPAAATYRGVCDDLGPHPQHRNDILTPVGKGSQRADLLSGPLNRLSAILSLLHPLDRYRNPSAIGSAIWSLGSTQRWEFSTASFQTAWGAQPRESGASCVQNPFKTSSKQKRDRGRDVCLVAPSNGCVLYYLCFTPSTAIVPPLR